MLRQISNIFSLSRLWALGHFSRALEGAFQSTRLKTWSEGSALRIAAVGLPESDPESIQLLLDALATHHPGSDVTLVAPEKSGEALARAVASAASPFPELKSIETISVSELSRTPFDLAVFLHPHPFYDNRIRAELPGARRVFRRVRARRRWVRFRNLELYEGSLAARIIRALTARPAGWATAALARAQDAQLVRIVHPQLRIARRWNGDLPCEHPLTIRVFPAPFAKRLCPDCGMGVTPAGSAPAILAVDTATYGPGYARHFLYSGDIELGRATRERQAQVAARLSEMGFDPDDAPGGCATVLDYGCGAGRFAAMWTQMGWNYVGVDGSAANIDFARKSIGQTGGEADHVRLLVCSSPDAAREFAPFGAVFLAHVLEHLPDPVGTLDGLRALTEPGGWIYVEVPDAFAYTWDERSRGFANPEHLWDFTPAMLRATLHQAGWDEVRLSAPNAAGQPFVSALARNPRD